MERSQLFFQEVEAPQSVWDVGIGIVQAINADAFGIKCYDADIALAIHANYDGGEDYGYEVWHRSLANLGKKLVTQMQNSLVQLPTQNRGIFCDRFHNERAFWKAARGRVMSVINYFYYYHPSDNEQMKPQKNITPAAQLTYQGIIEFIETDGHYIPIRS
jgi:N-acetylmuramoyl-L-alanine amidase